ncbi:hypothetical protein J3459_012098 [Metarhizium acridum]|uniref:uncharacterized protein n=1 Tax=Metarhizium acridum TaxID=92637 RepID=UPI001C6B7CFC|nr:hypothetical protein J3458_021964 [Metarhizium acridum]KAG8418731.1 hypothetical protein J3459_012098 [Metarhizium acridum]
MVSKLRYDLHSISISIIHTETFDSVHVSVQSSRQPTQQPIESTCPQILAAAPRQEKYQDAPEYKPVTLAHEQTQVAWTKGSFAKHTSTQERTRKRSWKTEDPSLDRAPDIQPRLTPSNRTPWGVAFFLKISVNLRNGAVFNPL